MWEPSGLSQQCVKHKGEAYDRRVFHLCPLDSDPSQPFLHSLSDYTTKQCTKVSMFPTVLIGWWTKWTCHGHTVGASARRKRIRHRASDLRSVECLDLRLGHNLYRLDQSRWSECLIARDD